MFRKFLNNDETKFAIIPDSLNATVECNIISLGIGNDILAEKRMNQLMPWCRFYGADPVDYRVSTLFVKTKNYYRIFDIKYAIFESVG